MSGHNFDPQDSPQFEAVFATLIDVSAPAIRGDLEFCFAVGIRTHIKLFSLNNSTCYRRHASLIEPLKNLPTLDLLMWLWVLDLVSSLQDQTTLHLPAKPIDLAKYVRERLRLRISSSHTAEYISRQANLVGQDARTHEVQLSILGDSKFLRSAPTIKKSITDAARGLQVIGFIEGRLANEPDISKSEIGSLRLTDLGRGFVRVLLIDSTRASAAKHPSVLAADRKMEVCDGE